MDRRALLLLANLILGCATRSEVAEEPPPSAGGVVIVEASAYTESAPSSAMCSATLFVVDVRVRPGCVIDERVTAAPATLTYPCGGGPASASFGGSRFEGSVTAAGAVDLQINTGFDFSDGCHWQTKQSIAGNLSSGVLSYEYREEPDEGQSGCAAACIATASVNVNR